jgi:hypothetical protein
MASDVNLITIDKAETTHRAPKSEGSRHLLLRISCWTVALVLGAWQAWSTRWTMYPDGISYLDMGDAFWKGDWHNGINNYWSPVYPLLLGLFLKLFKPSPKWEFPLVHAVNFLLYVVALISFDFFLRTFFKAQFEHERSSPIARYPFPAWIWVVAGYCAFVISSLCLITIAFPSPDMLVAAVIYLASALLLRIQKGKADWHKLALLGVLLGFGYWTKTVMFLMSGTFITVAAATRKSWLGRIRTAFVGFAFFAGVAAPLVIALSIAKGRPTFGDSGKINYEISVEATQFFIPRERSATHPVRKLDAIPEAYEYGTPIVGTYPLWYDPSYWHEGIQLRYIPLRQARTVLLALAQCVWILFNFSMGLSISVVIFTLYLLSGSIRASIADALRWWVVWVPALAAIGLYSLVVIEPRYVAAQFCLVWIVSFSGILSEKQNLSFNLLSRSVCALALLTCTVVGYRIWDTGNIRRLAENGIGTPKCEEIAAALADLGLKPGDKIALISDWLFPSRQGAYIARLDRLHIIGEVRPETFWTADAKARSNVMSELFSKGATAVLIYKPEHVEAEWQRVGSTEYYFAKLP